MTSSPRFTIALPSKGAIAEPTLSFLADCGLRVDKPNPRQYTGSIPALPGLNVLFQRVTDVVYKVADGTAQLGITGLDVVHEYGSDELVVIHPELRYGHCRLVVAVPEAWIDADTMIDLAEIALDFRETKGRNLRIATTYPNSTRQFLHSQGIYHFTLVNAEGAIEAAPTIGYADIIVDLVQTGTTLRENHLKELVDGTAIESQACLIGNRRWLETSPELLEIVRQLLEHIDASLLGRSCSQLTANIPGDDAEAVSILVSQNPVTRGLLGPTIAPIPYLTKAVSERQAWFTVSLIVANKDLLSAVDYLRTIGAVHLTVIPVRYVFLDQSPTFGHLKTLLRL
ncbi:MAG: ATP phosphoribosyltransferase [Anaerolinea sp.]|nr:ATP phosphoribosyltransferase [Anaerolinea sp.]